MTWSWKPNLKKERIKKGQIQRQTHRKAGTGWAMCSNGDAPPKKVTTPRFILHIWMNRVCLLYTTEQRGRLANQVGSLCMGRVSGWGHLYGSSHLRRSSGRTRLRLILSEYSLGIGTQTKWRFCQSPWVWHSGVLGVATTHIHSGLHLLPKKMGSTHHHDYGQYFQH